MNPITTINEDGTLLDKINPPKKTKFAFLENY